MVVDAVITECELVELVEKVRPELGQGKVSEYLSQLAEAEGSHFSVALAPRADASPIVVGEAGRTFAVQSVVKVFTLLMALRDHGADTVFKRVGRNPVDTPFNSLNAFESVSGLPANPFVNSGALVVVEMVMTSDQRDPVARVVELVRNVTGSQRVAINTSMATEEFYRGDQNRALAYLLRSRGLVDTNIDELLWAYYRMCAIEVNVVDLARAGAALAGTPGEPCADEIRLVRRLMLTTGMYGDSGRFASVAGIPAKCGISGATLGVIPHAWGVGAYGPALDTMANSIGGVRFLELLSTALGVP